MLREYRKARNDKKNCSNYNRPWGETPNFNMDVDINDFHCSFGHAHVGLLHETARQRNNNLTGTLQEYQGCSIAKGRAKPISTTTETRAGPGGEDRKPQSSDPKRWSLLEWSPTRAGKTKRTSGSRGATLNQSTSRLAAVRAKMRTEDCTSSLSAPRRQLLLLLPRGGPRNRHC